MATESRETSDPRRHPPQSSSALASVICTAEQDVERLTKLEECQTFPADIEYEILLRLPVKTLCRFKCSSRSWYSLISSPQFQNHHFTRSQRRPLLLTLRDYGEDPVTLRFCTRTNTKEGTVLNPFSINIQFPISCDFVPIQSCMGLVCVATMVHRDSFEEEDVTPSIFICNPSTEEIIALPHFQKRTIRIGFGHAASSQEFKVFRFFTEKDSDEYICEIFTLGTSDGRKAKNPGPTGSGAETPFLHGALHILPGSFSYHNLFIKEVAALDVETEEYSWIALPESYHRLASTLFSRDFNEFCLKELGGSLWLNYFFEKTKLLRLWLLKDYKNADWVEGYCIDLSSLGNVKRSLWTGAVGVTGDGSVLLTVFVDGALKLLSYDPHGEIREIDQECLAKHYVETFYSLGSR